MSGADLSGYLVGGEFDEDVRRWGLEDSRPFVPPSKVQPPASFADRLPYESARESLKVLAERVAADKFPYLRNFGVDHSFGLDFAAREDLECLDSNFEKDRSSEVFPLASDGGGNVFCLMSDGTVSIWNHEEENVEEHTRFSSLDETLWCLLRVEALGQDKLHLDEVRDTFESLESGGAAFYWEQVAGLD